MAYSPNEHITIDEELLALRGKGPFRVFIKSKLGKYGIKLWVPADAKNFMPATCKYTKARVVQ